MGTSKNALFMRLLRQFRAQMITMDGENAVFAGAKNCSVYDLYIPVLGFGFLRHPTSCIHAVVCAVLPCTHKKITIFSSTHTI